MIVISTYSLKYQFNPKPIVYCYYFIYLSLLLSLLLCLCVYIHSQLFLNKVQVIKGNMKGDTGLKEMKQPDLSLKLQSLLALIFV